MAFLLLHGLGSDRSQPLSLLGPALPSGAKVTAPDIRAHGGSPLIGRATDFSFEAVTAELVRMGQLTGLNDEPLTIIGISLGAALALQIAKTAAFEVERLILLRPAFTDEPLPANLVAFPVIGELLHQHPPGEAEHIFRTTSIYRAIAAASKLGAAGAIEQFRKPDASRRSIRLVELPRNQAFEPGAEVRLSGTTTTIVAARRDPLHPESVAALWNQLLPGSSLTVLPARDDGLKQYFAATRRAIAVALR